MFYHLDIVIDLYIEANVKRHNLISNLDSFLILDLFLPVKRLPEAILVPQNNVDSISWRRWRYITRKICQHARNRLDLGDWNCNKRIVNKLAKIFVKWQNFSWKINEFGNWVYLEKQELQMSRKSVWWKTATQHRNFASKATAFAEIWTEDEKRSKAMVKLRAALTLDFQGYVFLTSSLSILVLYQIHVYESLSSKTFISSL